MQQWERTAHYRICTAALVDCASASCLWSGPRTEYLKHWYLCRHRSVRCVICREVVPRQSQQKHESECKKRCDRCNMLVPRGRAKLHDQVQWCIRKIALTASNCIPSSISVYPMCNFQACVSQIFLHLTQVAGHPGTGHAACYYSMYPVGDGQELILFCMVFMYHMCIPRSQRLHPVCIPKPKSVYPVMFVLRTISTSDQVCRRTPVVCLYAAQGCTFEESPSMDVKTHLRTDCLVNKALQTISACTDELMKLHRVARKQVLAVVTCHVDTHLGG